MKKMNAVITIAVSVCALVFSGCASRPSEDDKALATIGSRKFTLGELKKKLAKVPPYYRNVVEGNKKRFLDETLLEEVLYEEAVRRGLDNNRDVKEIVAQARKKILVAKLIELDVESKIDISDAEAMKFYEEHKEEFRMPELWRASHILVATEKEAEEVLAELANGANFEEIAKARSTDATASRGGDVGYFRKDQVVPEFESACVAMSVGQTSGIVKTQFGYHIIRLTDKKEPGIEPFEKVSRAIKDRLKKDRRSECFDSMVAGMKKKYGVKIEDDVFATLELLDKEKAKR